jgi:hypothetical protein
MFFHWLIRLLEVLSMLFLGMLTLWLLCGSLVADRVRRSSPQERAEIFLRIRRAGTPFFNMKIIKSHYLIGRGPECDISLRGTGIPMRIVELRMEKGGCFFRSLAESGILYNGILPGKEMKKLLPGDEIMVSNYIIMIGAA